MNKVIIMGRLTADPELRQTQSGISTCRFNVAVNRRIKNEQGEYEADFISCQAWRQTAEFINRNFRKGQMTAIEGTLRTGRYQDKNHSDVTHYTTDILVENVEFCGSKSDNQTARNNSSETQNCAPPQAATTQNQYENANFADFEEILGDDAPF